MCVGWQIIYIQFENKRRVGNWSCGKSTLEYTGKNISAEICIIKRTVLLDARIVTVKIKEKSWKCVTNEKRIVW